MSKKCIFVVKDDSVGILALYREEIEAEIRTFEAEDRDLDFETIGKLTFPESGPTINFNSDQIEWYRLEFKTLENITNALVAITKRIVG